MVSADSQSAFREYLKDCRAISIWQEYSPVGPTIWRVQYIVDPDREFSTLDDDERAIKSRCNIRSVQCTQHVDGTIRVEVEWI